MKVLIFSDFHFFKTRLDYQLKTCKWIADFIDVEKPDLVVNCGDTNHSHDYVDVRTLGAICTGMSFIIGACKTVNSDIVFISGNHDRVSKEVNFLKVFAMLDPAVMCVMNEPERYTGGFAFCPWFDQRDKKEYLASLKALGDVDIIFSHWPIEGIPFRPNAPVAGGLSEGSFPGLVINGHYHHPGLYYDDTVVTVGSVCYHNFSDVIVSEPRGILILEGSGSDAEITRHHNPHTPIYHTVDGESLNAFFWKAKEFVDQKRIKLKVNLKDIKEYNEHLKLIDDCRRDYGMVKLSFETPVKAMPDFPVSSLSFQPEKILNDYVEKSSGSYDVKELKRIGMELFNESIK